MKFLSLRNRWVSHLACAALGAFLCGGVYLAVNHWRQVELRNEIEGRWSLTSKIHDPSVRQVICEYRPDGTFAAWQIKADGTQKIVEHGIWWVSGGRLMQEYASFDGRPVPVAAQPHPEAKVVVLAGPKMALVYPAGFAMEFGRADG
jgi:hypothetical protein